MDRLEASLFAPAKLARLDAEDRPGRAMFGANHAAKTTRTNDG